VTGISGAKYALTVIGGLPLVIERGKRRIAPLDVNDKANEAEKVDETDEVGDILDWPPYFIPVFGFKGCHGNNLYAHKGVGNDGNDSTRSRQS
jgi:hypothetical protein